MAKKTTEKDVLIVRDEKTGELSVVAGLDADGSPKRTLQRYRSIGALPHPACLAGRWLQICPVNSASRRPAPALTPGSSHGSISA